MSEGKILVVEDEIPIRMLIHFNLQRSNFDVIEASTGKEAMKIVHEQNPSLVLLDIMLPDMNGFEICTKLRVSHPGLPIVIVSARSQDMEKIMALELGADDYVVKPFNPLELVARIRSVLRRTNQSPQKQIVNKLQSGPYFLDTKTQQLYKREKLLKLRVREYQLMKLLLERKGEPIPRNELLDKVWGVNYFGDPKTVDVHIRRLREKIEDDPSHPVFLITVWGFGYCFRESEIISNEIEN
jgi:DNA-binding response OmpR family regulator